MKGFAYFLIMVQLEILASRGFVKFKKNFQADNHRNQDLIGRGIAYRFNNFKNKRVLKQA